MKHPQELVYKSGRNARFPSSSGLSAAHHKALAVLAANQNSRRESHDDSSMMGVVIQRLLVLVLYRLCVCVCCFDYTCITEFITITCTISQYVPWNSTWL